ncbi:MAG: hypothetical protein ACLP5H_04095 [Desulfomonilaceae bacterium]
MTKGQDTKWRTSRLACDRVFGGRSSTTSNLWAESGHWYVCGTPSRRTSNSELPRGVITMCRPVFRALYSGLALSAASLVLLFVSGCAFNPIDRMMSSMDTMSGSTYGMAVNTGQMSLNTARMAQDTSGMHRSTNAMANSTKGMANSTDQMSESTQKMSLATDMMARGTERMAVATERMATATEKMEKHMGAMTEGLNGLRGIGKDVGEEVLPQKELEHKIRQFPEALERIRKRFEGHPPPDKKSQ